MMFGRSAMVLVTALLMFPQIVETIYSPALTDISRYFSVSAAEAAQTLSVYFIGFAVGVLYWGRFSDRYGRRPALLAGLATYALGCVLALAARDFTLLLVARILSAFGAATGSVVSQTILRDRFNGRQLAALFDDGPRAGGQPGGRRLPRRRHRCRLGNARCVDGPRAAGRGFAAAVLLAAAGNSSAAACSHRVFTAVTPDGDG
jgi:MFS family permease